MRGASSWDWRGGRHCRLGLGRMREPEAKRVPVIDITDLYHPPQDPGDNLDLIAAYGCPRST